MLHRMDRVVFAADDPAGVGSAWERFVGAEPAESETGPVGGLDAVAHRWRVGDGWLEVLEPTTPGRGPVGEATQRLGAHLFAAGLTTGDVDAFAAHLADQGVTTTADGERVWFECIPGLRLVVGPDRPEPPVGLLDRFYEATVLVDDADPAVDTTAKTLGLDPAAFEPIASNQYGYVGTLTLFDPDRLDRVEIIKPTIPGTTMFRWCERSGGGLYMAFAETGRLDEIEERAQEAGAGVTAETWRPALDGDSSQDEVDAPMVFLHPSTLGGMMLGISPRTYAWTWSGHVERVDPSQR